MEDCYNVEPLTLKEKKRKNSKSKGNTFERKVATILNKRFDTNDFSRTPGSGAFATTHKLPEHLMIFGDLITPKEFKFIIEAKKGYNRETLISLFNNKSILRGMIDQAERDSERAKKKFLLIISQDRQKEVVISNFNFEIKSKSITLYLEGKTYYMMQLSDVLSLENTVFFSQE